MLLPDLPTETALLDPVIVRPRDPSNWRLTGRGSIAPPDRSSACAMRLSVSADSCRISSAVPDRIMLLRGRKACDSESLANHTVRIEIYLPVVLVVTVWPHRQHWTGKIE